MNKELTEKLCDYSTLNKDGEEIADAHCVGCRDHNYKNCGIYKFQSDSSLTEEIREEMNEMNHLPKKIERIVDKEIFKLNDDGTYSAVNSGRIEPYKYSLDQLMYDRRTQGHFKVIEGDLNIK